MMRRVKPGTRPSSASAFGVLRPINENSLPWFRGLFEGVPGIVRGTTHQDQNPALSLVMRRAVEIEAFGNYDTKEVQSLLYDNIPSLRKPVKFQIGSIGKFVTKSANRLAIVPDQETCDRFKEETAQIIDTLAINLDAWDLYNLITMKHVPHVSGIRLYESATTDDIHDAQRRVYANLKNTPDIPAVRADAFIVV